MTEAASVPGVIPLRPGQVLDQLTDLHDRYARPGDFLVSQVRAFGQSLVENGHGGEPLTDLQASTFFWPVSVKDVAERQGASRYWIAEISKDLFQSTCFQVTGEMMQIATDISLQTAKGRSLDHIEEPELPAEHGFMWFDDPLLLVDANGRRMSTRAVSWGAVQLTWTRNTPTEDRMSTGTGVRIVLWNLAGDPGYQQDDYVNRQLGPLQFDHVMTLPFGERFPNWGDGYNAASDSSLHYVHTIWRLMGAEVIARTRAQVDRSARRRALRSIRHDEVNVITLRRSRSVDAPEGVEPAGPVDWQHRWLVVGHYRHIDGYDGHHHHFVADRASSAVSEDGHPLCATCGARGTWVRPFIKGPDGKPIRAVKGTVYKLAR